MNLTRTFQPPQADTTPEDGASPSTPVDGGSKRNMDDAFGAKDAEDTKKPRVEEAVAMPWANPLVNESREDRYRYNGTRGWDSGRDSGGGSGSRTPLKEEAKPEAEAEEQDLAPVAMSEPVPGCPGWMRTLDFSSMSFYYYKEGTTEFLWEPPPGAQYDFLLEAEEPEPEAHANGVNGAGEAESVSSKADEGPLASTSSSSSRHRSDRKSQGLGSADKKKLLVNVCFWPPGLLLNGSNRRCLLRLVCRVGFQVPQQVEERDGARAVQVLSSKGGLRIPSFRRSKPL
jgi:hypothetical protein